MSRVVTTLAHKVEPLRAQVLGALRTIRPMLQRDGGDVVLVDVDEEGVVCVRLLGACVSCPSSEKTLAEGIEKCIKDAVPGVLRVDRVGEGA